VPSCIRSDGDDLKVIFAAVDEHQSRSAPTEQSHVAGQVGRVDSLTAPPDSAG